MIVADRIWVSVPSTGYVGVGRVTGCAVQAADFKITGPKAKYPTAWDEVSDWIDRHGSIANADVVQFAGVDTLKASKLLTAWREQGSYTAVGDTPGASTRVSQAKYGLYQAEWWQF